MDEAIRELDRQGVWEPCDKSEWGHIMVTPMKPDGTIWITMDFSPLNEYVVPTRYLLPLPDELFVKARGSKFFSKLDLVKAFHQIELHPDSQLLTCTLTPLGP